MSYSDRPVGDVLGAVASERVTPAGGTAVAIVGAFGAALCEMAARHSLAAEDSGEAADSLVTVREELGASRERFLELADADAAAVEAAFGPESGDVDQTSHKRAVGVPLSIAEEAAAVLEQATPVATAGRGESAADAAMGAFLVHATLRASTFAVRYNLDAIEDADFVAGTQERVGKLDADGDRSLDTVLSRFE